MVEEFKKLSRKEVKKQLNEIIKLFHPVLSPKAIKKKLKDENVHLDSLQELIDYLRVVIKYELLDIEALKRERNYLKKLLENNK